MQHFSHGKNGSRARAPNDDVAQNGGITRVSTKSCSLGLQRVSLILNIHACYGQLTPVKARYPLTCVV